MSPPGSGRRSPPPTAEPTTTSTVRAAVATSMAGKAVEMVTLVLLATVVPRVLGPADYGRFAVPLTIVTLGSLAMTLGGPTLMARFVPAARPEERVALACAIGARLARGRALQLAVVVAVGAGLALVDPAAFPPLEVALVLAALVLNVATTLALQVTLGLGRAGPWSLRYPLQNVVLVVAVLVLHPVAGVTGTIVAIVVAAVAATAFAATVLAPVLRQHRPRVPVPAGAIHFGVLQAAGAALVQCTQRGGVLAVALLAGSTVQTGYAALAVGIALGATYAVLQAFTVSLPHLAADHDDADTVRAEAVLRRLAGLLLVGLLPATALVAVLLEPLVPLVFGADYDGADAAFAPALAVVVLAPLAALVVQVSALRLRPQVALAAGSAGFVTFVLTSLVAVPAWQAAGGTAATLAGVAAGAVASMALLPGAVRLRVACASFGGAALVLTLALAA